MRHRPPPFCFFTQGDAMEQRNRGIDLLRMTAMWMVVILHILNKGGVLAAAAPLSAGQGTARLLETAAYCAVNCYGLISGYVGVQRRFRYSGALALWLRVAFYTLGITAVFACLMPGSVNGDRVLRAFFPVLFRQYWYVTAYFGMCLFIPFFNLLLNRLSKGQLRLLALSIVLVFSVLPTKNSNRKTKAVTYCPKGRKHTLKRSSSCRLWNNEAQRNDFCYFTRQCQRFKSNFKLRCINAITRKSLQCICIQHSLSKP